MSNRSRSSSSSHDSIPPPPPPPEILPAPIPDSWCFTHLNITKFSYIWTIGNFSYCPEEMGEAIRSSTFSSSENETLKWCMRMIPKGLDEESKDHISLYLLLLTCEQPQVQAKFKFSILNADKQEVRIMESHKVYIFQQGKDWGFKNFILRRHLFNEENGLLPAGELSIYCEVSVVTDTVIVSGKTNKMPFEIPKCSLAEDMTELFDSQKFCDITFVICGKECRAHKAILVARSAAFATMFEDNKDKNNKNRIEINDVRYEVMVELLRFVYSGLAPNIDRMAESLLAAANKFDLNKLKMMCEEELCKKINLKNAAETLMLAHHENAEHLKEHTIKFINVRPTEVINTRGWRELTKSHPALVADALRALVMKQVPAPGTSSASCPHIPTWPAFPK